VTGLSRKHLFAAVEASLKRLNTTYIDLYQVHRYDYNTDPEETMEALNDLVRMGKVRYIGASSMYCWQFAKMNHIAERRGWAKFVSMQNL
jgi:aryl-alcohol dehydrogenase-like predicted oxidoreductase